jgi:maltose O-acetyltransferase
MSRLAKAVASYRRHLGEAVTASPWIPWQVRWRLLKLRGVEVTGSPIIEGGVIVKSPLLKVGARVHINSGVILDNGAGVTLEDDVSIGPGAIIITSGHTMKSSERRGSGVTGAPVVIKRGSWIGAGAMVLPGVTVAGGCVIAAGSIVTKDTEPDGLYIGSPARRVRDLD